MGRKSTWSGNVLGKSSCACEGGMKGGSDVRVGEMQGVRE